MSSERSLTLLYLIFAACERVLKVNYWRYTPGSKPAHRILAPHWDLACWIVNERRVPAIQLESSARRQNDPVSTLVSSPKNRVVARQIDQAQFGSIILDELARSVYQGAVCGEN